MKTATQIQKGDIIKAFDNWGKVIEIGKQGEGDWCLKNQIMFTVELYTHKWQREELYIEEFWHLDINDIIEVQ